MNNNESTLFLLASDHSNRVFGELNKLAGLLILLTQNDVL